MMTNLKRLTDVANQKKSIDDILNSALEQKCSLYLNIKDNVTLSFNAIHYVPNSNGDYNKITSARNVSTLLLTQGQKFMLSEKAIQAFTLHDIVEGEKLSVVFSQQEGLEINNSHLLSSYSHRDVFVEDSESESRAPYIKLIESAIESLKKTSKSKPNAKAIHEWLDMHEFESVAHAQDVATKWLWTYNNERPNTAIGGVPPRTILQAA